MSEPTPPAPALRRSRLARALSLVLALALLGGASYGVYAYWSCPSCRRSAQGRAR